MFFLSLFICIRTEGRGSWGSTGLGDHRHDDSEMDKDWRREHISDAGDASKPTWENGEESGNRGEDADDMDTGATAEAV